MPPTAFIINPIAGAKRRTLVEWTALIRDNFFADQNHRDHPEIYFTTGAGDATTAAKRFLNNHCEKIIAVGGDGTVNEIADTLVNSNATLGIVPVGSGNGLARHLKISRSPRRALRELANFIPRRIDVGMAATRKFFTTAGFGFDALISEKFSRRARRGGLNYVIAVFREFSAYQPQKYRLSLDGEIYEQEALLITFANAAQWGNAAKIAPNAEIDDGILEVVIVKKFTPALLLPLGVKLFTGRLANNIYVEYRRCRAAQISGIDENLHIHCDGEVLPPTRKIDLKILPHALTVLTPTH